MIDVLIVDDDNLVRRGLMSAMPWGAFGMRVVGEAGNGEKALEFLASSRVELVMTDLAMPVMSGIELLRIVRERYPDVAVAVLTLHQDFEYIQEALRLGAIDYIAKVQLEKDQFAEVLGRIHTRIMAERSKRTNEPSAADRDAYAKDSVYALLALGDKPHRDNAGQEWKAEADGSLLLWEPDAGGAPQSGAGAEAGRLPELPAGISMEHWRLFKVEHAAGVFRTDLRQLLRRYIQKELFYDCDGSEPFPMVKSVRDLQAEQSEPGDRETGMTKEALHAFSWVYNDASFEDLLGRLKSLRLPVPKLTQLLYGFTVDWNRIYRTVTQAGMALPDAFLCWRDVVRWMETCRESAVLLSGAQRLSKEVSGSIMAAVKIVHDELELPLFAIDVAKRVNVSRSYFNQCFKETAGYSFNEYLRKVRIDKAREYLSQTAKPIVWIAEHTGYADEKYFSRVFREQTGMLPSEYRLQHKRR